MQFFSKNNRLVLGYHDENLSFKNKNGTDYIVKTEDISDQNQRSGRTTGKLVQEIHVEAQQVSYVEQ